MSLKFNIPIVRFSLQFLLFFLYWSLVHGNYPFIAGPPAFILLFSLRPLFSRFLKNPLMAAAAGSALLVLLFPLIRLFLGLLPGLPLSWDAGAVLLYSFIILLILPLLSAFWIGFLLDRFPGLYLIESLLYAGTLAFLLGKPAWSFRELPGGILISFIVLGLGIPALLILLLSRGKKDLSLDLPGEGIVLLLIVFLVLIPLSRLYRSESVREGGGLLKSSLFQFDFTNYLTLESRISMKDELVFLIQKEGPGENLFLRRFVLGAYSRSNGFFRASGRTPESPGYMLPEYRIPENPVSWDIPSFSSREWVEQTLYFINFDSSAFMGMNLPGEVIPYQTWEESSFSRIFKVRSSVSQAHPWDLFNLPSPREESVQSDFLSFYTDYEDQEDIRFLAEEITRDLPGYFQKVNAIENYFHEEFLYSLNPGTALDGDQLRHFLFSAKKGYCSYFAFSMTLLCRSLGIPARVALGFWVDTGGEILNFYPVNANQAHAWVEVYFPEMGWIEFDPTSRTLAPGEDFEFSRYNPEELEPYIREILENQENMIVTDIQFEDPDSEESGLIRSGWRKIRSNPLGTLTLLISIIFLLRLATFLAALRGFPRTAGRIIPYYRIHRALLLTGLMPDKPEMRESSPLELALLGSERGTPLFAEFTKTYQALRFSRSGGDILSWFKQGREVRKELYGLIGWRRSIAVLLRLLVRRRGTL